MCYCFLLFFGQCGGPPLGLAPPILLLTCCPSLSPCIILSYFSPPLSPAALCIVIVLFFLLPPLRALSLSLRLAPLMFSSPLQPSPRVSSQRLRVSAHSLTFFLSRPVLSAYSCFFPLPPRLPHEDSAPAEVDELPQPQRAGEKREKFTRGQRGEAEEGRSQRHLEQVHQIQSRSKKNVVVKLILHNTDQFVCVMLQHPQRCHSSLPEERFGR